MSTDASQAEVFEMEIESTKIPRTLLWACAISVGLHIFGFAVLSIFRFAQKMDVFASVTSVDDDYNESNRPKFDTTVNDQIGSEGDVNTFTASQEATTVLTKDSQQQIEKSVDSNLSVPIPVTDDIPRPSKANLLATVVTAGATAHANGVEGAIDRLAWEIANSLREKKTLVVWLFDVSPSLSVRREQIASRVENVYTQLNQLNVGADKALKSAVAIFGEKCTIVTEKPLDDPAELVKTVRKIKSESSGNENTFSAVNKVADTFKKYRSLPQQQHDVMIIVVTDEEGSDPENLEQAIVNCKRHDIRCYCVGDSAPFGRKNVEAPFEMENGETVIGVMTKGPESKYPELVRLGFWGTSSYDLDDMSSGFGPYGLTRLCAETNGLYFVADSGRGQHRFDSAVMRNYSPDYRPIQILDRDVQQNKAKYALIEACMAVEREAQNRKVLNISMPRLDFRAENDAVLRQDLTEAQKPIADLNLSLEGLVRRLEMGEKDRAKMKEARWRASYDLAMGRALALHVRAFGYNSMLAEMKANPKKFEKTGNNQWLLIPSKEINSGVTVKKPAVKAVEYLSHVIDDHPGTPWALLAERERGVPLGWEWKESHYDPNPVMAGGNQKAGPKFIEVEDPKTKKKIKKQVNSEPVRRDI